MSAIEMLNGRRCVGRTARTIAVALSLVLSASLAWGQMFGRSEAFDEARQLEEDGQSHEAFLKYLSEPGGEFAAATLARPQAREFLKLLADQGVKIPAARRRLIEAELLLATRDQKGALTAYRGVAAMIATKDEQGWEQGLLPRGQYFVEPPPSEGRIWNMATPFMVGPGSHRDNWLLRRFIALEAWDDARREFARVWQLHREATQPCVIQMPIYKRTGKVGGFEKRLVRPTGFSGGALQFALDYGFFLQKRNDADQARAVLIEAMTLIDMDRNPNDRQWGEAIPKDAPVNVPERSIHDSLNGGGSGVPRSEFIRLAFGAIKTAGQDEGLVNTLTARIEAGENRLRRVLAQVRLLQGHPDAALRLELDYIVAAKFDALSTAYRRAIVLDSAQKVKEAAAEYETVLAVLDRDGVAKLDLPDPLEPHAADARQFAVTRMRFDPANPSAKAGLQGTVLQQLERLYAALGETDKALEMARRGFVVNPHPPSRFGAVQELERKHRAVNQSAALLIWAKQQLGDAKDHHVRACMFWLVGDWKNAAESLAKTEPLYDLDQWKESFRTAGQEPLRELLKALIATNPKNAQLQLELLDLDGVADGPELTQRLELLLESNPNWAFPRGKGARNRTQFRDHFELASRLMRLYERASQLDKLQALGLRIARGEKPFEVGDLSQHEYRISNGLPESANAALALAIEHADNVPKSEALGAALEKSTWTAAREQFRRRWFEGKAEPPAPFLWSNLPDGVNLIASNENVLALANDDRYVYAGHPWGVAVYDLKGQPVTRIALGDAARALVALDGHVWAGTPKGLFRIARADWSVAHQWLHEDVPANERHAHTSPGASSYWFDNSVYALAADGEQLWISLHRNIQRLNTRTLELRAYSFDELKISSWAGFDQFVIDGQYVWIDSDHAGVRRYDRVTDEWSAAEQIGPRNPIQLVGLVDGRIFGDVYVDDTLRHRLCLIDRKTLAVTVIPLATKKEEQLVNSPLRYFGKRDEQLVFGTEWPAYVFDEAANTLKPIRKEIDKLHERLRLHSKEYHGEDQLRGVQEVWDRMAEFTASFGRPDAGAWLMLTLADGTRVLGSRQNHVRYEYPREDTPHLRASAQQELWDRDGGLFFVKPDNAAVRVSSAERSDSIRGDLVSDIVLSPNGRWLCTSLGVAQMDREGRIINTLTRADGLCANRVTSGTELLGKQYFTTAWGDSGGGLAVFDAATSVFTTLSHEDGLPTDKLEFVTSKGDQLLLGFGAEYLRYGSGGYRRFEPITFDPKTNQFGPSGEPKILPQNEAEGWLNKAQPESLPILGGTLSKRFQRNGQTYLCGTRGLVIFDGAVAEPKFAPLGAKLLPSVIAQQLADAEQRKPIIKTSDELATALKDENPLYRANALAALLSLKRPYADDFLPLLASQLSDPNVRVRGTALYFVTQFADDKTVIPLLRARLNDSDRQLRELAMVDLVRRGQLPEMRWLRQRFETCDKVENYRFGAKSSIGVQSDCRQLLEALAPHATPEVFSLLLQFPPSLVNDREKKVFPALGESLLRHPAAVDVLLKARDDRREGHYQRRDFARDVFQATGKVLLPKLHAALKSDDRVIRSNAARACGAIGNESSVAPLLKAVDLESGLSRASIVWALGELKAKRALPVLANLYAEAKREEQRQSRSGAYGAQQVAAVTSQYERLSNLESLSTEWDELKAATLAPPVDPENQEELLQPQHLLEAVAKIGPELSQEFYRTVAAAKDSFARAEAAVFLAAGSDQDRAKNLVLLKNLLTDADLEVRLRAAVSLILLGELTGRGVVVEALNSKNDWEQRHALRQLLRLMKPDQRAFAKTRIEAIAADLKAHEETRRLATQLLRDPTGRR